MIVPDESDKTAQLNGTIDMIVAFTLLTASTTTPPGQSSVRMKYSRRPPELSAAAEAQNSITFGCPFNCLSTRISCSIESALSWSTLNIRCNHTLQMEMFNASDLNLVPNRYSSVNHEWSSHADSNWSMVHFYFSIPSKVYMFSLSWMKLIEIPIKKPNVPIFQSPIISWSWSTINGWRSFMRTIFTLSAKFLPEVVFWTRYTKPKPPESKNH